MLGEYFEVFDDQEDEEDDEDEDADDADEDAEADEGAEELPDPTPEQLIEMFQALKDSPESMAEAKKQVTEQLGIPGFLFDMVINNSDQVMEMMGDPAALETCRSRWHLRLHPAGRRPRATTLDMLELKEGQRFLYLFDYGDEWHFDVQVAGVNDAAISPPHIPGWWNRWARPPNSTLIGKMTTNWRSKLPRKLDQRAR